MTPQRHISLWIVNSFYVTAFMQRDTNAALQERYIEKYCPKYTGDILQPD